MGDKRSEGGSYTRLPSPRRTPRSDRPNTKSDRPACHASTSCGGLPAVGGTRGTGDADVDGMWADLERAVHQKMIRDSTRILDVLREWDVDNTGTVCSARTRVGSVGVRGSEWG